MNALTPALGNSVTSALAPARREDLEAAGADLRTLGDALRAGPAAVPAVPEAPAAEETLDNVPGFAPRMR